MESADIHEETHHHASSVAQLRLRLAWLLTAVVAVLLLAIIPPLLNVSRFQQRIASNLSNALGRPVHLQRVSLSLLPLPGFTLQGFVVDEDPQFGYEPILRADQVRVTVRIPSLWSHHVEFSRISLTEPTSLNIVRLPDGRWNFETVLLRASRIEAAPTSQRFAGAAPRFPYVEASGARINLKLGDEKTPFSLTDSDFALWLPGPRQWRFRLKAHPARTDVAASDAGLLRLEGALGDPATQAQSLPELPIDLRANWQATPLAGLSRLALGRDAGLRGDLTLDLHALGTVGHAALSADLKLTGLRRSEFVPPHVAAIEAGCTATASHGFQSFESIECQSPAFASSDPVVLIASGSVPDIRTPETSSASLTVPALPSSTVLSWIDSATPRPITVLTGSGVLAGSLAWHAAGQPTWSGEFELSGESLKLPQPDAKALPLGDLLLRSAPPAPTRTGKAGRRAASARGSAAPPAPAGFDLSPILLPLGGRQPAILEGHFDAKGYTLHLTGSAIPGRLLALADAFPQFGEGLRSCITSRDKTAAQGPSSSPPEAQAGSSPASADTATPVHFDLTAVRHWGRAQTWGETQP